MYRKFLLVLILFFATIITGCSSGGGDCNHCYGAGTPIPTPTPEARYAIMGAVTNLPRSYGNTIEFPDVPVTLLDSNGNIIASATVSYQDGNYRFDNIPPGNYRIVYGELTDEQRIEKDVTVSDSDVIIPDVMFVFIGKIITFGDSTVLGSNRWIVLDIKDGKALILTEGAIECRPYHVPGGTVAWETCTLRTYLNGEFYNKFSNEDKARIIETNIINQNNQWFGTNGGITTNDKIFLLSLEEVVLYFGDSGQLADYSASPSIYAIDDDYNDYRVAYTMKELSYDTAHWNANVACVWWLRSPGDIDGTAAAVDADGWISLNGMYVSNNYGCLRPALWLNL